MENNNEAVQTLLAIRNGHDTFSKANTHIHSNLDLLGKPISKTNGQYYSEHYELVAKLERVTPFQVTREKVVLDKPKREYAFSNTRLFHMN